MKVGDLVRVQHWVNMGEKAIIVKELCRLYRETHPTTHLYRVRIIRTGNSMKLRESNMVVINESR